MFTRKCPKCQKDIVYKSEYTASKAIKKNSTCKKCALKFRVLKPNSMCTICNKEMYRPNTRKKENNFCSYSCRNKFYSGEKSFAWKGGSRKRDWDKKDRQNKKIKAVEMLGGKCEECGYNKCIAALDFHHRIPEEKDFQIKDIITRNWKYIEQELSKCRLLCSNCHREEHWKIKNESTTDKKII